MLFWTGLWLAVMVAALKLRPLLPVDETRYLAVAWEMWRDKTFLVPHLNGETYSHKPPLLFWLMHLGWALFGVNDVTPRLVAPLFGLFSLFLTFFLGRRLWPGRPSVAVAAPLILLASLFWTLFTSLTMFDMMLTFCALLGMLAIVSAWQDNRPESFFWLAVAIGLGGLAKGPAILLTVLPAALLAPLWAASPKPKEPDIEIDGVVMTSPTGPVMWSRGWKKWYVATGYAFLGGLAITLAWAIPAAILGGEEYRNAIFWGQSAGRMVDSFAHGRPWWWFLAVLPGLILPWTLWPAVWRSLRGFVDIFEDNGLRFCLVWFLPALLIFSAISGKQLHYLLPVFPALALIFARLLVDHHLRQEVQSSWHRSGLLLPGLLFIVLGLALAIAPLVAEHFGWPEEISQIDFRWGPGLAFLALMALVFTPIRSGMMMRVSILSLLSTTFVISLHLSVKPVLDDRFNLKSVSKKIGVWQRSGIEFAFVGKYHGQFNFMGRLEKPIYSIGLQDSDMDDWFTANPQGRVIIVVGREHKNVPTHHEQSYRGRSLVIIDTAEAVANPAIIDNP